MSSIFFSLALFSFHRRLTSCASRAENRQQKTKDGKRRKSLKTVSDAHFVFMICATKVIKAFYDYLNNLKDTLIIKVLLIYIVITPNLIKLSMVVIIFNVQRGLVRGLNDHFINPHPSFHRSNVVCPTYTQGHRQSKRNQNVPHIDHHCRRSDAGRR